MKNSQTNVCFRVDASFEIGSGHVMRCLALAKALRARGAKCLFICRAHPGHLFKMIKQHGFKVCELPAPASTPRFNHADSIDQEVKLIHDSWLGCDWRTDAAQTGEILSTIQPEWLIIDHYALAQPWEELLSPYFQKLMVIDDLSDRAHWCDLLLDQNLGRHYKDYFDLVPAKCQVLLGPEFALLRPEFAALRAYSLGRRLKTSKLNQLLISMGGVDMPNATGRVLEALKDCPLPDACRITVVMGVTACWHTRVRELSIQMPWPTKVLVNVPNMAKLMADSDLAIGGAGSTSWERCCLGLPALTVILSDNQISIASALESANAAKTLGLHNENQLSVILKKEVIRLINDEISLKALSKAAAEVTDGSGINFVVDHILTK